MLSAIAIAIAIAALLCASCDASSPYLQKGQLLRSDHGASRIQSPDYPQSFHAPFDTSKDFTIAAWVNIASISATTEVFVSLNAVSPGCSFSLTRPGDTGVISFQRLCGASSENVIVGEATPSKAGSWYHVVGVSNAEEQTISLFINGGLKGSVSYATIHHQLAHVVIDDSMLLSQRVHDTRVYAFALSPKEVIDLAAVAYFPFDEERKEQASVNGHAAVHLHGMAQWTKGSLNLSRSAKSYASVNSPLVDSSSSFTIAAWVQLRDVKEDQTVMSLDGNSVSAFSLQYSAAVGNFAFALPRTDSIFSFLDVASAHGEKVLADDWYHVTGVYNADARTISLYLNGLLQDVVTHVDAWEGAGNIAIGRGMHGGEHVAFLSGLVDEVHIYNIALDQTSIHALMGINSRQVAALTISTDESGPAISPLMYGLMFEDISHSGDGGIYAELIRNRIFQDNENGPDFWSLVTTSADCTGSISLDKSDPVNTVALTTSLKLEVSKVLAGEQVGVANTGFWGIPVRPNHVYRVSFYAKSSSGFHGKLRIAIEDTATGTVFASAFISGVTEGWKQYEATLVTGKKVKESLNNRFVISTSSNGTLWFNLVSLFPSTWENRENGLRPDLMQLLHDLKPSFLRFPGGNFLEGNTLADYFPWKKTVGELELRPGHADCWGYRSSDGLGLLEYLTWCEDLDVSLLLAVYAGYALNGSRLIVGTPEFDEVIQDALDEIEYVTGDVTTKWGALRAAHGHPERFALEFVEIGNEDMYDYSGSYDSRFAAIFDAIRAKYPSLKLIATTRVTSRVPDVYDDHYYPSPKDMISMSTLYNTYDRSAPKIFVGEYAAQEGSPTPDLSSALGDAAFLTGLERNSDVVIMNCYAPLLANVNALTWNVNLIGFDALDSYGSPSFHMLSMFSKYLGDVVAPTTLSGTDGLYFVSSKSTTTGKLYIKVVNPDSSLKTVTLVVNSGLSLKSTGTAVVLAGSSLSDTNTLSSPMNVVPVVKHLHHVEKSFDFTFDPFSITVIILELH